MDQSSETTKERWQVVPGRGTAQRWKNLGRRSLIQVFRGPGQDSEAAQVPNYTALGAFLGRQERIWHLSEKKIKT